MNGVTSVAEQAAYFERSAAVRVRADLCVARVGGDDARTWLNGQTTNDLRGTKPGDGAYGLVVSEKGKVLADVWVLDRGRDLAIAFPCVARELLHARFEAQIFMEDANVADEPTRVVSVQGPRARDVVAAAGVTPEACYRCAELTREGMFVTCHADDAPARFASLVRAAEEFGGGAADEAGYELARVRAGRPRFGSDFSERNYPQEAGLKDLAVSFSKGCYLGQEVVCTLEHRGQVQRHLVRLETTGAPDPGAVLTDARGEAVGALTSVVRDPERERTLAFGYVKRALASAGTELHAGTTALAVVGLVGTS
jgi:hypothetical protein